MALHEEWKDSKLNKHLVYTVFTLPIQGFHYRGLFSTQGATVFYIETKQGRMSQFNAGWCS